jgi:hypothetical protein
MILDLLKQPKPKSPTHEVPWAELKLTGFVGIASFRYPEPGGGGIKQVQG